MGMFDEYIPDPPLRCPACGSALDVWQGKDGPNALMVWRQGIAEPIDQSIDDEEVKLEPEQLAKWRLPKQFTIYTFCCGRRFPGRPSPPVEAECYTSGETWSRTELVTAETAKQKKNERRGDFKARVRWLSGKAT